MFKYLALLGLIAISYLVSGIGFTKPVEYIPSPYELSKSVVKLIPRPDVEAYGSGVIIELKDYNNTCKISVATAEHVVNGTGSLFLDGTYPSYQSISHTTSDIALVLFKVNKACSTLPYKAVRVNYTTPNLGDTIFHIGYPAGQYQASFGTYVGKAYILDKNVEAITSVAGPGSSGGAIFNARGDLIGILVMGEFRPPFRNYYTPIFQITEITASLNNTNA